MQNGASGALFNGTEGAEGLVTMLLLKPIQASARPLMFLHSECLRSQLSLQGKTQGAAPVIAEGCGWKCRKAQKVMVGLF